MDPVPALTTLTDIPACIFSLKPNIPTKRGGIAPPVASTTAVILVKFMPKSVNSDSKTTSSTSVPG